MIQRSQTIWLLFATVCAFISLRTSFYSGIFTNPDDLTIQSFQQFTGTTNMPILILTVICGTLSFINIFLFKNRSLQLKLVLTDLLLASLLIVLYFGQIKRYNNGDFSLTSVIVFLIPIFLILAARGIYSDQKLVKSADRLR